MLLHCVHRVHNATMAYVFMKRLVWSIGNLTDNDSNFLQYIPGVIKSQLSCRKRLSLLHKLNVIDWNSLARAGHLLQGRLKLEVESSKVDLHFHGAFLLFSFHSHPFCSSSTRLIPLSSYTDHFWCNNHLLWGYENMEWIFFVFLQVFSSPSHSKYWLKYITFFPLLSFSSLFFFSSAEVNNIVTLSHMIQFVWKQLQPQ